MVSGAIFAGLISVEALFPYALEKWFGISGNWALLFAGLALIVTLIQNPDGVAGATYRKHQLRSRSTERRARAGDARAHGKGALMDRILTTHAGSLVRPQEVLDFLAAMERGETYDEAAYEQALADAVADVVRRQAEAGIDVVDDGEMGKATWITYLYERVSGLEPRLVPLEGGSILPPEPRPPGVPGVLRGARRRVRPRGRRTCMPRCATGRRRGDRAEGKLWFCTGPIEYDGAALAARHRAPEGRARRGRRHRRLPPGGRAGERRTGSATSTTRARRSSSSRSPTRCTRSTRGSSTPASCVQVDDAVLLHEYDSILSLGGSVDDYRRWAELRVEALVHALSGIPEERIRYHVCYGSWHGPHAFDPPLAEVIDLILRVRARYYLIEQGNARHEHEWRLWEDVALPEGKVLVPGVVTHHTNVVEHPELVAERLVRLAKLVGRENVMGGTDCGFAQGAFVQRVHPTIQWAKLEAFAEGARLATERLW